MDAMSTSRGAGAHREGNTHAWSVPDAFWSSGQDDPVTTGRDRPGSIESPTQPPSNAYADPSLSTGSDRPN